MRATPFELEHERHPDAIVVRARGKFDGGAAEAIEALLPAGRAERVVLNLGQIDYISSSGVAALVKLSSTRPLRIASPAQCVRDVLSLAGIERILSIHGDEEAARAGG
ncbi:MAG: STAS domain-containing protein [Planctomycetes bacterium]|nr:STAS domain-containing protein [Planctomycetota bacterium]MCW8140144.1 STAS domain-containing protein [Planctomycetota bacterium]